MTAAQDKKFKIGLLLPTIGPFASTGRQIENGVRLYMAQFGTKVAGREVEIILKDDTGDPGVTKRLAQDLIVTDKVDVLAGFGLTPSALATAPIATQSKTPMVVMAAATSIITEASPYMVRTSMTIPQVTIGVAEWAPKNNIKTVVTLVTDYGPGIDAEKPSATALHSTVGAFWPSCVCRCAALTTHRFCKKYATSNPTRCLCLCLRALARRC